MDYPLRVKRWGACNRISSPGSVWVNARCHNPFLRLQILIVGDEAGLQATGEAATGEARDGITPPMRNARERIFRKPIDVPPDVVQRVEYQLLTILAVSNGWGLETV